MIPKYGRELVIIGEDPNAGFQTILTHCGEDYVKVEIDNEEYELPLIVAKIFLSDRIRIEDDVNVEELKKYLQN